MRKQKGNTDLGSLRIAVAALGLWVGQDARPTGICAGDGTAECVYCFV
jgi:hypothetical protein